MNSQNQVEEAHRLISMAILGSADGVSVRTPEAMLNYGNWRGACLSEPKPEVRIMALRYGVRL